MKIKASKKLIASLFALVVAVSLAATTTYAWFTMNAAVSVGTFDLKVETATPGLYVSTARNGVYTTAIDLDDYITAAKTEYAATKSAAAKKAILDAEATRMNAGTATVWATWVETANMFDTPGYVAAAPSIAPGTYTTAALYETAVLTNAKYVSNDSKYNFALTDLTWDGSAIKKEAAAVGDDHSSLKTLAAASSGGTDPFLYSMEEGYLTFKLYFRGDGAYNIYLNSLSKVTPATTNTNTTPSYTWTDFSTATPAATSMYGENAIPFASGATSAVENGANGKIQTRAAYAARVKFDITTEATGTANTKATIWEPNASKGFSHGRNGTLISATAAKTNAHRNLAQDVRDILFAKNGVTSANIWSKTATEWNKVPTFQSYAVQITDFTRAENKYRGEYAPLITLTDKAGAFYAEMTVTIWLEGWDEDCLNSVLDDEFSTLLSFVAEFA